MLVISPAEIQSIFSLHQIHDHCIISHYATYLRRRDHHLVNIDTELSQLDLSLINLLHKLLVRFRNVVEGENAPSQSKEEECAKRDEGPEGELHGISTVVL